MSILFDLAQDLGPEGFVRAVGNQLHIARLNEYLENAPMTRGYETVDYSSDSYTRFAWGPLENSDWLVVVVADNLSMSLALTRTNASECLQAICTCLDDDYEGEYCERCRYGSDWCPPHQNYHY